MTFEKDISMLRKEEAVKKWFPLAAIASGIAFVVTFLFHLPIERVIVASLLAGVLVFSGFFFRSFGKDESLFGKDKYKDEDEDALK
ncbi:MAG TPA: hypothetical protein VFP49_13720 [Nitrososphaeraceae archaeon]|jgi:hypothetical protein|nr:hypothetical protein [Nitrososphaeraceae archaeon]